MKVFKAVGNKTINFLKTPMVFNGFFVIFSFSSLNNVTRKFIWFCEKSSRLKI